MKSFKRICDLNEMLLESSALLFGARGTGKSYLIRQQLGNESNANAVIINLLRTQTFRRLNENPSLLADMIEAQCKTKASTPIVVIDEVQRIPELLNEAHWLIEERRIRFLLTGSSARKLKRNKGNLLAGRARINYLHPLTCAEIPEFNLDHYLQWGGLPEVYQVVNKTRYIDSYIETYLKEEILAEQAARNLNHFSRFLTVAALCSGELLNYQKVANDTQISPSTVRNYFDVMADTLIGSTVGPWLSGKKRKAIQTAKFYFFDIGVRNRLLQIDDMSPSTPRYGNAFEHFIFMELRAFLSYKERPLPIEFWRTVNKQEVDFLVGSLAIEVKSTAKCSNKDGRHLHTLREEGRHTHFVVVSKDPLHRVKDGIEYIHWTPFLENLYAGKYDQ